MLESWSMKKLLAIIVLGSLLCNYSNANPSLKGIDVINITVENLPPSAKKCGLTKEQIRTSAKYILQNSKIKIVPIDQPGFSLYIQVNVGYHQADYCYSSARIEVYDSILHKGRLADAIYYNSSVIASGGTGSAFGNFVLGQIESLMKELVVKWSDVNN